MGVFDDIKWRSGGSLSSDDDDDDDDDDDSIVIVQRSNGNGFRGSEAEDTDECSRQNESSQIMDALTAEYEEAKKLFDQRKMMFLKMNLRNFDTLVQAFKHVDEHPTKWYSTFAMDIPKKPRDGVTRLPMAKTYLVGSPINFFHAFSSMHPVVADEVIRLTPGCPAPLYFDIEIKNEKLYSNTAIWRTREDIDPYFFESVKNKIKQLFEGLHIEECDHIEEDRIENIAVQCILLSHISWTEEECRTGLQVLTNHISRRLKEMLRPQIDEGIIDELACTQMHVTSSCRKNKLSFHVIMDCIFCDHQSLSMPLVVHDIKGFFMEENMRWLSQNSQILNSDLGRFRVRALIINELLTDQGEASPIDTAVYSPFHLLRCVMSSKYSTSEESMWPMVPLRAYLHSCNNNSLSGANSSFGAETVMTDDVKVSFESIFRDDNGIDEWRNHTVTCRSLLDPRNIVHVIAQLNPNMWNHYPSLMTWKKNAKKFRDVFDGITYPCEGVVTTVTELYGGNAESHYTERRNVRGNATLPDTAGGVACDRVLSCHAFDKVISESGKPCYLYQVGVGEKFFCGRGSANEKTPSAHMNFISPDGGIVYTCFCKQCQATVYRSVPTENLIDAVERRYPFSEGETITSNDPAAKLRHYIPCAGSEDPEVDCSSFPPAGGGAKTDCDLSADNWRASRVEELEMERESLFDQWQNDERGKRYDWTAVVQNVLRKSGKPGPTFYIIDAPCETGKTHEMKLLCKATHDLGGRYMFVVHRRSLADLMHGLVDCFHYQHCCKGMFWDNADSNGQLVGHFVSVYNSLSRFGYGGKPDVVIIDEIGAFRRHVVNRTTRHCLPDAHRRFVRLIRDARLVVLMQHIVTLEDVMFITSLVDVDPQDRSRVVPLLVEKPTVMHPLTLTSKHAVAVRMLMDKYVDSFNAYEDDSSGTDDTRRFVGRDVSSHNSNTISSVTWSDEPRTKTSTGADDVAPQTNTHGGDEMMGSGKTEPQHKTFKKCQLPFVVFCTKKSCAVYFAKLLKAKAVEIGADPHRIKLITASLKHIDAWNRFFFEKPNDRASDCDVLIATSVIGSGVSLDTHFGSFVAFLYRGILTVDEGWQFIRRVRVLAALQNAEADRRSLLYIEDGSGGGGCIDIISAVEQGVGLHEDIVSDIVKNSSHWHVRAKLAAANEVKDSLHFNQLNLAYWTSIAERRKSQSKHGELWNELLKAKLDPNTYESVDDTHGYLEEDLKATDDACKSWHELQLRRVSRCHGRGSGEHCLVPSEGSGDEDIEKLLDDLNDDDVLRLALSMQSVECSLSWGKAFPIGHGDKYVSELIQMKLMASMDQPIDGKKLKSMQNTYSKHYSSSTWRNKYIRMAFGLCHWITAFYTHRDDDIFGMEVFYDLARLHEHIGGGAVANVMKTRLCQSLLPILFTAKPSELPYIKTPGESPFYVGLEVVHDPSLCAFFRWALLLPENVGEVCECPMDMSMEKSYGIELSEKQKKLLRRSTEVILTHLGKSSKKITLLNLVSDVNEAHRFVKILCRHIGIDLRTSGSLRTGGERKTVSRNMIRKEDIVLALGTPPQICRHFTKQLQLMGSGRNLPAEGYRLVDEALALHEQVCNKLKIASVASKVSLNGSIYSKTVTQRTIEATKSEKAIAESDAVLLDEQDRDDRKEALMKSIVKSAVAHVQAQSEAVASKVTPGLFHLIDDNDLDSDEGSEEEANGTEESPQRPYNRFVSDMAEVDDDGILKRKHTVLSNDEYDDDGTTTTYPLSNEYKDDGTATTYPSTTYPYMTLSFSESFSTSASKSPSASPVKKKLSKRDTPTRNDGTHTLLHADAVHSVSHHDNTKRSLNHGWSTQLSPDKRKQKLSGGQHLGNLEESNTGQEKHALENKIVVNATDNLNTFEPIPVVNRIALPSGGAIAATTSLGTCEDNSRDLSSSKCFDAALLDINIDQLQELQQEKSTSPNCAAQEQKDDSSYDYMMGSTVLNPRICPYCQGSPKYRCATCGCGIKSEIIQISVMKDKPPTDWNHQPWLHKTIHQIKFVDEAIYGEGNEDGVLATAKNETTGRTCSVTRKSMKCLRPKTWLNDEVIDYFFRIYLAHVDKRLCDDNSIPKRSYIFPPQFMLRLLDETNEDERLRDVYNYKQVMRWTKGVDIFTQRRLIFPINKTGSHWMLACVLFDSKEIRYYDSMCPSDTPLTKWIKKRLFGIAQYIEDEYQRKLESAFDWSRWKIVHCNTPQQENGEFLFVSFHVICVYVYTHIQFIILTPFYHAS